MEEPAVGVAFILAVDLPEAAAGFSLRKSIEKMGLRPPKKFDPAADGNKIDASQ